MNEEHGTNGNAVFDEGLLRIFRSLKLEILSNEKNVKKEKTGNLNDFLGDLDDLVCKTSAN